MNILFVSHCNFTGNSAMHIVSIANRLAAQGIDCAVCVPHKKESIFSHGVPAFHVQEYSDAIERGVSFAHGGRPDLIHAWTPRELVRKLTEQLSARYGCPYLVHLEDNEEHILLSEMPVADRSLLSRRDLAVPEHRSHPVRYKEFLAGAVGVTALMDRLLEFKPPEMEGTVFWPGFDPEFAQPPTDVSALRRRLGLADGEKVLVYTGNIHAANRREYHSLVLAVAALNRRGHRLRLIKTGWNHEQPLDEKLKFLKSAILELGFLPRKEIPRLLALADALVQPGAPDEFNEYRFPSKLPEYLVSGRPVILPRSNIGRFLKDGQEALLLKEGHALEIAQTLERLLGDDALARRIGEGGRAFAMKHLTWDQSVEVLRGLYRRVLAGGGKADVAGDATSQPMAPEARQSSPLRRPKLMAFYLPQYHPIKENDQWWGKGFTEWSNVVRGQPSFAGHYQPHLPADLGFYDLRLPEVMEQQATLAKSYGVHGFCFYYYWFDGHRLLERPLENLLATGRPDFPFCICWANENWTRRWDGLEREILCAERYAKGFDKHFIRDVMPVLKDRRYLRVDDKPVLLVYRINLLPNPAATAALWRKAATAAGLPGLHLCAVQTFGISDPRVYGFDAAVEFPPHTERALLDPKTMPGLHPEFAGYIEDYAKVACNQMAKPPVDYTVYRGVMPAWDNTARRGRNAHVLVNSSPAIYKAWLQFLVSESCRNAAQEPLLFINAWNEWAEGNHLEPDQKYGHEYLQATYEAWRDGVKACVCEGRAAPLMPPGQERAEPVEATREGAP